MTPSSLTYGSMTSSLGGRKVRDVRVRDGGHTAVSLTTVGHEIRMVFPELAVAPITGSNETAELENPASWFFFFRAFLCTNRSLLGQASRYQKAEST